MYLFLQFSYFLKAIFYYLFCIYLFINFISYTCYSVFLILLYYLRIISVLECREASRRCVCWCKYDWRKKESTTTRTFVSSWCLYINSLSAWFCFSLAENCSNTTITRVAIEKMIHSVESIEQSMEFKIPFDDQIFTMLEEADRGNEFLLEAINYASYAKHAMDCSMDSTLWIIFSIATRMI